MKKEINTVNLFNKKNIKLNTTINSQNGELAASNAVNAIKWVNSGLKVIVFTLYLRLMKMEILQTH